MILRNKYGNSRITAAHSSLFFLFKFGIIGNTDWAGVEDHSRESSLLQRILTPLSEIRQRLYFLYKESIVLDNFNLIISGSGGGVAKGNKNLCSLLFRFLTSWLVR